MEPILDWRERLEAGARRLSVEDRITLLERLLVAHESYEEIMAAWAVEVRRRIESITDETEFIPMEEVLAELDEMTSNVADWQPPPIPEALDEIEDQALHLEHDDFFAFLVNLETELPSEIDPSWRATIQARIRAVPIEIERRYREQDEWESRVKRGETDSEADWL
jgi:hypothetical protein